MTQNLVNLLMFVSCSVVLIASILAINEMTVATNNWIRISYSLISTASLAGLLAPLIYSGWQPSPACFFGMAGVAIMMVADRRRSHKRAEVRSNVHVIHQKRGAGR